MTAWNFMMEPNFCMKFRMSSSKQVFTGKHLCWGRFLISCTHSGLQVCNSIKNGLQHRFFPVKFVRILRTPFIKSTSGSCFWNLHALSPLVFRGQSPFCYPRKMVGESQEWFITWSLCYVMFSLFWFGVK